MRVNHLRECDCLSGKPQGVSQKLLRPGGLVQRRLYCPDGGTDFRNRAGVFAAVLYTEMLSGYPDVLATQTFSQITGYGQTFIHN